MTATTAPTINRYEFRWSLLLVWIAAIGLLFYLFRDSLVYMTASWQREEYSHGYMIPLVAIFLAGQKMDVFSRMNWRGSWSGLLLVMAGLASLLIGELSAIYTIIQYGFLLSIYGLAVTFLGWRGVRLFWASLTYLLFMIPLPTFLYNGLSSQLQLLSSLLGVEFIRLFGVSVNLQGNVVDLGAMQLQVAEACSGLRYLFPLMSFGFLIGYLYRGPAWQRIFLSLSTVPITVLMNSFRIGVIGLTVDQWGIAMAEGFLHDFEGWVVFIGCVALLFLEIAIFQLFKKQRRPLSDLIATDLPKFSMSFSTTRLNVRRQRPFLLAALMLLAATPLLGSIAKRAELAPTRETFSSFPLAYDGWIGREGALDKEVIDTLKFSDYITADYRTSMDPVPVNFYSAWYKSQKKGASIHSPRSCIPGGGWVVESLDQKTIPAIKVGTGASLSVNRAVIRKGDTANVVYYWFDGRGRNVTNEYLAKWFIFWDSLTRSRSDGALVRVVTSVPEGSSLEVADQRLVKFLKDFYPQILIHVP